MTTRHLKSMSMGRLPLPGQAGALCEVIQFIKAILAALFPPGLTPTKE
ncbi:MAG: hypothetical protein NTU83_00135 [Candidatus Hydrogenedentes bacterium]|nr:hypothetical protein [Candidatus Hydrogenedentota bacterium]